MRYSGRAQISAGRARSLAVCDRCGRLWNHDALQWQYQWQGPKLQNLRILVCEICLDKPQQQLRTIILPADPLPILDPRAGEFGSMIISSAPPEFSTIVPSNLSAQSTGVPIGDLTTESSIPLISEITVTPTFTASGYTDNDPS